MAHSDLQTCSPGASASPRKGENAPTGAPTVEPKPNNPPLPEGICSDIAWAAFDHVFSKVDWRLEIASTSPFSVRVVSSPEFDDCLEADHSSHWSYQARAWIAGRVMTLASTFDSTELRRRHLQLPTSADDHRAIALVATLERRVRNLVFDELLAHFDRSTDEWQRKVQIELRSIEDRLDRWRVTTYLGFDQLVSADAARKAIRYVFSRTHWHLVYSPGGTRVEPDWRFEQLRSQRSTLDEQTRARSLVARCVESLVEEHAREQRFGVAVAPMTRIRLKCELERRFHQDGVWGLVETALRRDRSLHFLSLPEALSEPLASLVEQQRRRMGQEW